MFSLIRKPLVAVSLITFMLIGLGVCWYLISPRDRSIGYFQDRYPFESLESRLAYEHRRNRDGDVIVT